MKSDGCEPTFDGTSVAVIGEVEAAIAAFANADLIGAVMDESIGGAQLPGCVAQAGLPYVAANVSTSAYLMLTIANVNLVAKLRDAWF